MVRPVTFEFESVRAGLAGDANGLREKVPAKAGVFRIFDVHGNLILLDKSHNLAERIERFYSEERDTRALDLRGITGKIEFCRTDSPFETLYLLHAERRRLFPDTYHRMRTFPRFYLLKINRKQRFPRLYASRQVKPGVEYFGPFRSRAELDRMKSTLERTFRLRPCEYNIRGDRPYPDCLYFQMRTCSRPCNGDITRDDYLRDVAGAIAFLQGREASIVDPILRQIETLSEETRFEEAARLRKRMERIRKARKDHREPYFDLWQFDFVVVLDAASARRRKIALVDGGRIVSIEEHAVETLEESLGASLEATPGKNHPAEADSRRRYDDFCLVSAFMLRPARSVRIYPRRGAEETIGCILGDIRTGKRAAGTRTTG